MEICEKVITMQIFSLCKQRDNLLIKDNIFKPIKCVCLLNKCLYNND